MLVYQSFGQFKNEAYRVYTIAEHLETYRDEYPTRRRQLNAVIKDMQNMDDAIASIETRLNDGRNFTHYLGDKYFDHDLSDMKQDRANIQAAHDFIKDAPCPQKVAKELDALAELYQDAQEDAAAVGMQEINEPQTLQIELPAGVTAFDISNIFSAAKAHAHNKRMQTIGDGTKAAEVWAHIYDAAVKIDGEQLHALAWSTDTAVEEYGAKNCVIHL